MPKYKNQKVEIPKATLYELYWDKEIDCDEIARKFNTTKETVRRRFTEHGVPYHKYHNRELFVFRHRPLRHFYELYWGQDQTLGDIASEKGFAESTVKDHYHSENIAVDRISGSSRWFDKQRGIPNKYRLPSDNPVTNIDDPLPNNPDPSKYIRDETSIRFDKHKLYQLYWGYGFTISQIEARLDVETNIRQQMDQFGIPRRNYYTHLRWEPHKGIPPMYVWPEEDELTDEEIENSGPTASNDYKRMSWKKPLSGD